MRAYAWGQQGGREQYINRWQIRIARSLLIRNSRPNIYSKKDTFPSSLHPTCLKYNLFFSSVILLSSLPMSTYSVTRISHLSPLFIILTPLTPLLLSHTTLSFNWLLFLEIWPTFPLLLLLFNLDHYHKRHNRWSIWFWDKFPNLAEHCFLHILPMKST